MTEQDFKFKIDTLILSKTIKSDKWTANIKNSGSAGIEINKKGKALELHQASDCVSLKLKLNRSMKKWK